MKHIDAASHTRGQSEYVDDMLKPAEMLYAGVYSSPLAHGKIQGINTREAIAMDGIIAVLLAADIPGTNQIGSVIPDEPLLADEEVHYVGQPVAIVVGRYPEIVRKAIHKISMDLLKLPVITDPREAFTKGHLIGTTRTLSHGNVDSAWSKCDLVVEGHCDIGGQEHLYLETHRARAIPLEGNTIRIYSATQSPYAVQRIVAKVLGIPNHCVEVDVKRIGGGFGGKEDQATPWACITALAAWHTKTPMEMVLRRDEDIKMTGKRHPYSSDFKIGVTSDGKILAYEVKHYQNSGAAADLSTAILERSLFHSTNAYFIPNVRIFGACCRTNLPPNTAMRGFGGPQAMFVIESAISKVAERLGVSREEIQHKNLLEENDLFPYGQQVQNACARITWQEVVKGYKFSEIKNKIDRFNQTHFETKKGYAIMPICFGISFTSTFLNQGSSLMHVYTDGSVSITTGGVEMGQGLSTKIANIAMRALGIHQSRIKIESTNTTRIANMSPTAASSSTDLYGKATLQAIGQILDRLRDVAAKELGLKDKGKITIADERVLYDGKETGWTWNRLIEAAYFARVSLSAHAFYATPGIGFDRQKEKGHPFAYHVFGTAIIEVTLDCLRGIYDIDSVKIVHDLGRPINELVDRGQVEGGLAQGLGWMTLEELRFNKKGEYLSNSLATYKVPDVFFIPDDVQVKFLEKADNPFGPFGSKAVGEPPFIYGIGVFFAIRYAMRAFQPQKEFAFDPPLTHEKVLIELHSDYVKELSAKFRPV